MALQRRLGTRNLSPRLVLKRGGDKTLRGFQILLWFPLLSTELIGLGVFHPCPPWSSRRCFLCLKDSLFDDLALRDS
jgi:hypothetical protein